jgi:hypothetical protein
MGRAKWGGAADSTPRPSKINSAKADYMSPISAFLTTLSIVALSACSGASVGADDGGSSANKPDQDTICHVEDLDPQTVYKSCVPGQKVAFVPNQFGNEQLPVLFAAAHCDLRYSVVLTTGGVACIYKPLLGNEAG